jgi:hypothetical protein
LAAVDPLPRTTDDPIVVAQRDTSRAWVSLRLALAGLWLFAVAAGYLLHERPATLPDLYASVAAGGVASVHLIGGLPPEAESGEAELEMHWRTGSTPRGQGCSTPAPPACAIAASTRSRLERSSPLATSDRSTGWPVASEVAVSRMRRSPPESIPKLLGTAS